MRPSISRQLVLEYIYSCMPDKYKLLELFTDANMFDNTVFNLSIMSYSGGAGDNGDLSGEMGTVTGKKCPKGLYGTFCQV